MFKFISRLFGKKLAVTRPPWPSDMDEFLHNYSENISAFFRGKNLISGTVGSLPIKEYQPIGKEKDYIEGSHLEYLLNVAPNPFMDAMTFKVLMTNWLVSNGDAYAEKIYIGDELQALIPIHPKRVSKPVLEGMTIQYEVRNDKGGSRKYTSENLFHLHCYSDDGISGRSVLEYGRQSLDLTHQLESFGIGFFKKGIRPSGFINYPTELTPEAEKNLRKSFEAKYGGRENFHGIVILEDGVSFTPAYITPEQAQFLGTRKFQLYEIARWLGVPPHLLYELERATFSNIEQQSLDFLAYSIRFWLELWRSAIKRQLISPLGDTFVEFSTDEIVLIDAKTRHEIAKMDKDAGVRNTNEIRAEMGYRSIGEKGDIYLYPSNYQNAEAFLKPKPSPIPDEPQPIPDDEPQPSPIPDNPFPEVITDEANTTQANMYEMPDTDNRRNGKALSTM